MEEQEVNCSVNFLRVLCISTDLNQVYNCLDTLGKLPWPQSSKSEIWAALLGKVYNRGHSGLRLFEFVQISEFFGIYITDICQTSESFAKSVNLK